MPDHNMVNLQGSLETFQLSFPLQVGFRQLLISCTLQEGAFQVLHEVESINKVFRWPSDNLKILFLKECSNMHCTHEFEPNPAMSCV